MSRIGRLVDIDVADAFQMREHRQPRLRLHARHQALAAARHDHVDIAVEAGQHEADGGAVARLHDMDRGRRQAGLAQALLHGEVDGAAGAQAVGAAAQDGGIARFQAERAGVGGHVGPAFVDDADDAERHPHPLDGHAVGPRPGRHDVADRVLQAADDLHAGRHGLDPGLVEGQPVEEGVGRAAGARLGDILGIGGQDARLSAPGWRRPCASSARSFCAAGASASTRAAARASRPISAMAAAISPVPSMLFSGAVMADGPSAPLIRGFSYHVGAAGARWPARSAVTHLPGDSVDKRPAGAEPIN